MRSMRLMIPLAMLVFVVPAFAQDGAKSAAPETPTALALGSVAPKADVAMKGVDGKSLTLAQAASGLWGGRSCRMSCSRSSTVPLMRGCVRM